MNNKLHDHNFKSALSYVPLCTMFVVVAAERRVKPRHIRRFKAYLMDLSRIEIGLFAEICIISLDEYQSMADDIAQDLSMPTLTQLIVAFSCLIENCTEKEQKNFMRATTNMVRGIVFARAPMWKKWLQRQKLEAYACEQMNVIEALYAQAKSEA